MSIDKERLAVDLEYWNEVAPEGAVVLVDGMFRKWEAGREFGNSGGEWEDFRCSYDSIDRYYKDNEEEPGYWEIIEKPQPAQWKNGLPPVGVECEYTKPENGSTVNRKWCWCAVVAHDQSGVVIRTEKGHYHLRTVPEYTFRPLKTPEQRERDELVEAIKESAGHAAGLIVCHAVANALIKAGYRKQEQDK